MAANYSRAERRKLGEAANEGEPLRCPVCGSPVRELPVPPKRDVAYVRHRLWLICTGCGRSAAIDVRSDGRP